jgi:AcrR family transcriptional regulator
MNAMRLTQRTALPMFYGRGFEAVTVEEISAEVGMAASTIYRHFTTKEEIVLWDDNDAAIDEALESALKKLPPFEALRTAFVAELGGHYETDLDFQLPRIQYIYRTEQLHAAAVEADFRDRTELTKALEHFLSKKNRHAAGLMAGAALLVLDIAMDQWQQANAKTALSTLIERGFDNLHHLADLR